MAAKKEELRHHFLVSGNKFVVDTHYVPHKTVGSGAYGVVCSAQDEFLQRRVAIKKCTKAFEDVIDGKRILREVRLLRHLQHDNVVQLIDMIPPVQGQAFEDVYLILDFMESDLHKIIYSKQKLTDEHYQYFLYQLLKGLKYVHSAGVIHRDLKPSNLLVNSNCDLKICDFGLARSLDWNYELTEYVVTRWYRAPEIMCAANDYGEAADIWSVACILAELLAKKPLLPGDHYIQQLNLIFEVIGTPQSDDYDCITNPKAKKYCQKLSTIRPKDLGDHFKKHKPNPLALDLLSKLLVFHPKKRLTVAQALEHPYLAALHDPAKEQVSRHTVDFSFELKCKDRAGLKEQMLLTAQEVRKDYLDRVSRKQRSED